MSSALEEQRDFLLGAIRDLDEEHSTGALDDDEYAQLRDDLVVRAATVLRSMERVGSAEEHQAPDRHPRPAPVAAAIIVGVALLGVLAVVVLGGSSSEQTGDAVAGVTSPSDSLLEAASDQMANRDYLGAIRTYDAVLDDDPDDLWALTYRGWLLHLVSLQAEGEDRVLLAQRSAESLDAALERDPAFTDALIFRAIVIGDEGDPGRAVALLEAIPVSELIGDRKQLVDSYLDRFGAQPSTRGTTADGPVP